MDAYFTVQISWVPEQFATRWHPTTKHGPFAVLTRGAFASNAEAILWAQSNLNGTPYEVISVGA